MLLRRSSAPQQQHLHFETKRKRRFPTRLVVVIVVLLVAIAGAAAIRAATESTPNLTAKSVLPASVVIPGPAPKVAWPSTGEAAVEVVGLPPLGSSGPETPVPIASVAKIMTAYVLLADHPLPLGQPGFTVSVSAADVADYRSRIPEGQSLVAVSQGETLNELQLLQALLVGSGNNIAMLLANYDAGSVTAFVAKMNSAAQRLGMTHTTYTDPSGLPATTVSTARDQLQLAGKAMAIPVFAQTVALPSVNLPVAGTVENFDRAVGTNGYIGVKTGSTATAGGCLVFANRQTIAGHPVTILGAVFGQDPGQTQTKVLTTAAVNAATAIVQSVTSSVAEHTVLPAGTEVAVVSNAAGNHVSVITTQALSTLGFAGLTVPLTVTLVPLGNQLSPGQTVATVALAADTATRTTATSTSRMPGLTWRWRLSHLF